MANTKIVSNGTLHPKYTKGVGLFYWQVASNIHYQYSHGFKHGFTFYWQGYWAKPTLAPLTKVVRKNHFVGRYKQNYSPNGGFYAGTRGNLYASHGTHWLRINHLNLYFYATWQMGNL